MLDRMFEKRLKGYRAMGYEIAHVSSESDDVREHVVEYDQEALWSLHADPI